MFPLNTDSQRWPLLSSGSCWRPLVCSWSPGRREIKYCFHQKWRECWLRSELKDQTAPALFGGTIAYAALAPEKAFVSAPALVASATNASAPFCVNRFRHLAKARVGNPTGEEEQMYVITGATGHTGSLVADRLLARGEKVRVIGRDAKRLELWAPQMFAFTKNK